MLTSQRGARHSLSILLLCLLAFTFPSQARAQSGLRVVLHPPELDQFPRITLYLDAYDVQGQFIPSLDLNSFRVFEDGFERTVNEAARLEPGLHTIIALNLGATLSNRSNTSLPTRYEESVFAVASWLNELASEAPNQYSLTSNEGILAENVQDQSTFTFTLQNYNPNLFNFQPDFTSLSLALDIASKPNLIPLSKQAILYITPLPLDQELGELAALRTRAQELNVPINVWLVAPETASNAPAAEALSQLAATTGGRFTFYAEDRQAPDPESDLVRLRSIYRLRYTSAISQSGEHSVRVETTYGNQAAATADIPFTISLNLPTASLVNLPPEIVRNYVSTDGGRVLQPGFITLQASFIFPDGYERQLKATRLYVDGQVVAENNAPPYDFFGWPLDRYTFSGDHLVSVEVEDILGFRSISTPISVRVTVNLPYPAWLTAILKFLNQGGWIALAVLALGGAVILGLRLRRRALAIANGDLLVPGSEAFDPLLQSVPGLGGPLAETEEDTEDTSTPAIRRPHYQEAPLPRLVWSGEGNAPPGLNHISIDRQQLILGSDAQQVDICLFSPTVSTQHACLVRSEGGAVSIADLGSESGTWVNYTPVSSTGIILNHNDLVQIGEFTFRYRIGNGD